LEQITARKKSTDSERSKPKWTKADEKFIFEVLFSLYIQLLLQYGEDLSLIHSYFPNLSRKQVRRKVKEIMEKRKSIFEKIEQRAEK
jgi:hypothetical protein